MAKASFSKLQLKVDTSVKTILYKGEEIEVRQYLPIQEKIDLVTNVINTSVVDGVSYYNPISLSMFEYLYTIFAYTNINFTDKQKEDLAGLYDKLISSELSDKIFDAIPADELEIIHEYLEATVDSIYTYNQSALGILDSIQQDYSDLKFDTDVLYDKLADKNNLSVVRDVLTKLG